MEFAFYKEQLFSVTRKGKSGAEEIQQMMVEYRTNPFKTINDSRVMRILDYKILKEKDMLSGQERDMDFPRSNVLQFLLEDGTKISVRPSGTEPKIKFYFSTRMKLDTIEKFEDTDQLLDRKIKRIISSMNLE
jgi:phosphoglucomutase